MGQTLQRRYPSLSGAAVALGIVLVLLSQTTRLAWLRIFGALLITAGGLGIGAHLGLAEPGRRAWLERLREWRVQLGILLAAALVLPVVFALSGAVMGLANGLGGRPNPPGIALGGLVTLLMAVFALATPLVAVRSILRAGRTTPPGPDRERSAEEAT